MAILTLPDQSRETPPRGIFRKALTFQSNLATSGRYRADVDGLRAIAVLAVVFFHANILHCRGGFVGVDVFFVISGYLITSLIARDLADGTFSLLRFYERRMRRIFPALFGVLFFCVLAAAVVLVPEDLTPFGKALIATTAFTSNFYFWHTAQPLGYFARTSASEALLHTWSLAVEEQFYLVFPALLVLLARRGMRLGKVVVLLFAAGSFALNLWWTGSHPVPAFYLFAPRAWELLIGALLALQAVPPLRSRILREAAGLLGLAAIGLAAAGTLQSLPFPGYSVLVPCLGAWLAIYAGESGPSAVKSILSFRPIVFLGVISYSLYLWHWPLLVFARYFIAGDLTDGQIAIALSLSVLLAFLSFEYIERPFRGAASPVSRRQIFALGLAASAAAAAFGATAWLTHGLPVRYGKQTRQLIAANSLRRHEYEYGCANWRTEIHSISDVHFCTVGDPASRKIMFWGDSHVEQLLPVVQDLVAQGNLRGSGALFAVANGCLPAQDLNSIGGYYCDTFSRFAMQRAEQPDIGTVFIGFNTWWFSHTSTVCASVNSRCTLVLSPEETERRLLADLGANIRALRLEGKRVILGLPFPMYDKSIPATAMRNATFARFGLAAHPVDFTSASLRQALRSAALDAGADVYDPRLALCPQGQCVTQINGVSIYMDNEHLASSQSGILKSSLQQVLAAEPIATLLHKPA